MKVSMGPTAWVDLDEQIVSWPYGHRRFTSLNEVVAAVVQAHLDMMADMTPPRRLAAVKKEAYDRGYHEGWNDRATTLNKPKASA
jgi:hypothetical protein